MRRLPLRLGVVLAFLTSVSLGTLTRTGSAFGDEVAARSTLIRPIADSEDRPIPTPPTPDQKLETGHHHRLLGKYLIIGSAVVTSLGVLLLVYREGHWGDASHISGLSMTALGLTGGIGGLVLLIGGSREMRQAEREGARSAALPLPQPIGAAWRLRF